MIAIQTHRSASQINKYAQCSEQYRLSYVDKPDEPFRPAAWLAQGTAFHEAVRVWEESGRSPHMNIIDHYNKFYDHEIERFTQEQPNPSEWMRSFKKSTADDIKDRRRIGAEMAVSYTTYAKNNPFVIKELNDYTYGIEVDFEVEIGGILIKGAVDQIWDENTGIGIWDLKTGNREPQKFQLGIYKVAMEKIFNIPVVKAGFYYAKDSKAVALTSSDLARYDESYVGDVLSALDRGIQNEVFIPNVGNHCTMCPVKKSCREWN